MKRQAQKARRRGHHPSRHELEARAALDSISDLGDHFEEDGAIAVIGSITTATYRGNLHLADVPAGLAAKARGSFALAVHAGGPVKASASAAFADGIHIGLCYAAGAALLAAITVAVLTRELRSPQASRRARPELARPARRSAARTIHADRKAIALVGQPSGPRSFGRAVTRGVAGRYARRKHLAADSGQ